MKRITLLIVLLMAFACGAYAQLPPPHQQIAPAQRGAARLSLDKVEEDCKECLASGRRIHVRVEGRNGAHIVTLPDVNQVAAFRLLSERRGMVIATTFTGLYAGIVDIDSGEIVDELRSDDSPVTSPSGRYVAYKEAMPRRYGIGTWTDLVLAYDLTLTKEQNPHGDSRTGGFAVPPGRKFDVNVPNEEERDTIWAWLDSDVLVLIDVIDEESTMTVVDLRQGADQQKVLLRDEGLACKVGVPEHQPTFVHTPGTDMVSFTIARCGKVEVHVPGLQ